MHPAESTTAPWRAELALGFARRDERSVLASRRHAGPLRVQKALYPEGPDCCHVVVLHPPAGIAGGDALRIDIAADRRSQALLTTPGAAKWYRSAGAPASQRVAIHVAADACVEWLPQENIVFDGAIARSELAVALAPGARFVGLDIVCLGRRASGERFDHGSFVSHVDLRCDGALLWRERARIDGGSAALADRAMLGGHTVFATVLAGGADVPDDLLRACRDVPPGEAGAHCGITALPHLLVARYLGDSAEAARAWFEALWHHVRPVLCGRPAQPLRLWRT